jgi:hypothetical protein
VTKKDEETVDEPPVPDNQSPDTENEPLEDEPSDDELSSKIEGVVGRVLDKLGIKATGERSNEEEAPPEQEKAPDGTEGGGAPPSPSSPPVDVDAAVEKALKERDHAKEHEKLTAPPEPKPPRKGLARTIFGP